MSGVSTTSPPHDAQAPVAADAEPRWLSPAEQVSWRAFIDAIRLFSAQIDRELQQDSGLNHAYYQILVTLSEAPERTMRMSELAALTLTSRSRLSHAIARLEEAGWVARESCASDKRGSFAVMTDAGFAVLESAARGHVDAVRRNLFDVLTSEQIAELGRISAVLRDALRAGPVARCLQAEAAADDGTEDSEGCGGGGAVTGGGIGARAVSGARITSDRPGAAGLGGDHPETSA
jgi:DNA-binding MarR family transcriptional regulator